MLMIGKRRTAPELFDVGNVYPLALDPRSFHGQLAVAAPRLFQDQDFAACYHAHTGRPSVPPSQLALLTLLQHEAGCSDAEAVARSGFDLRWAAVLGRSAGMPLCAKSTLQLFRAQLILHDTVREVFQKSIQTAKAAGLLRAGPLRVALDTKPILGWGAVEDTYNLLATGLRGLAKALARPSGQRPEEWAGKRDLRRYFDGSIKGSREVDWSDPEARAAFLTEIVTDARRLLRLAGALLPKLPEDARTPVQAAATLLEQLLLQDVVESPGGPGGPASIREGTVPGRVPSANDPEQRHGRKSASKRFNGHKLTAAVDQESQILVDVDVLAGDAPDDTNMLAQVERVEENTGQTVAETTGDCAYGSGERRQEFADARRVLHAKVAREGVRGGCFPKSRFQIDLVAGTVTCPAGHTISKSIPRADGSRFFLFGAHCATCPLREQCTKAAAGRQIQVHPHEGLRQAARAFQATPEGRTKLRERVVIEHRLARLGQLGAGQARYAGRKKVRFQVLLAATLANLRWTWNWQQAQGTAPAPESDPNPDQSVQNPLRRVAGWLIGPVAAIFAGGWMQIIRAGCYLGGATLRPRVWA
jgi:hypothetical protein